MTNKQREFESLIDQNRGILYKVAKGYCTNKEDRNDLIQEILIQLWGAYQKYDASYKLSTWMYRIALNVAISFYRQERRRSAVVTLHGEALVELVDDTESDEVEEGVRQLYEFIGGLNRVDKAVVILYLTHESYRGIAEILGITETNVATKISRIKKQLMQQFSARELES